MRDHHGEVPHLPGPLRWDVIHRHRFNFVVTQVGNRSMPTKPLADPGGHTDLSTHFWRSHLYREYRQFRRLWGVVRVVVVSLVPWNVWAGLAIGWRPPLNLGSGEVGAAISSSSAAAVTTHVPVADRVVR